MRENYKGQRFLHFLIMTHIHVKLYKLYNIFTVSMLLSGLLATTTFTPSFWRNMLLIQNQQMSASSNQD